jgi:hypothetical protein
MELYYDGYSNAPAWIEDADLEHTNTILWHTFHQRRWTYNELVDTPRWRDAERIFLVGQEGDIDHWVNFDSRIHVWDSLVKPGADRFYSYFWWLWQTNEVNQHQHLVDRLTDPLIYRPTYVFDCIMGDQRLHRDHIYNAITSNQDTKKVCLTKYIADPWISGVEIDSTDSLKKFKIAENCFGISGTLLPFNDQQTSHVATWVPWKIYNQSWFSVVAETDHERRFFTEKTAKVLLAKKLFIMIGAAGALQDLRHLGFKTFDSVLDESYDAEPNDQKRWHMAFEQIKSVCSQKPEDVYQKILPILEHNQQLTFEIDWRERAVSEMRKIVHGH